MESIIIRKLLSSLLVSEMTAIIIISGPLDYCSIQFPLSSSAPNGFKVYFTDYQILNACEFLYAARSPGR